MKEDISEATEVEIIYLNPGSRVRMKYTCRNEPDEVQAVMLGLEQTDCAIVEMEVLG